MEALDLQEKTHGRDNISLTSTLNNLGELRRLQGRLVEAEQLARRALAIREKALGPDHPDVAASLNNLAIVFTRQGRAAEARGPAYSRARHSGKGLRRRPSQRGDRAEQSRRRDGTLGRKQEAEQLLRRSIAIREKALGPNHLDVAVSLDNLVTLLGDNDRYAEAEPLARRSLAIREAALGKVHPLVASSLNNLGVILDSTGHPQDAEPMFRQALDIRQRTLGEAHPDVANSFGNLGSHYLDSKDWQQAYDAFSRASAILIGRRKTESSDDQARADLKIHDSTNPFPGAIVAAYNLAAASDSRTATTLRGQAFETAQWIGDEQAARAIAGMSARIAAGNGDLSARVRERQDLNEQALAIDRTLIAVMSQPNAARNPTTEQALRTQASTVAGKIAELDRLIAAQFAGYSSLVARTPITIEDVQKQLGPNEALMLFATTARFTFVWTVTRANVRWHSAPIGARQLAETIGALRCGLDEEAWADTAQTSTTQDLYDPSLLRREARSQRSPALGEQLPFDLDRAYALYHALIEPVAKDIDGKELVLVPSGPLATLPFEVMLTEKPASQDLSKAPWLAKRFATTVLPSVSSLKALRQVARKSNASKPFAGFGNPLLNGGGQSVEMAERARQARLLQSCRESPDPKANQIALRGLAKGGPRAIVALSGGTADIEQLRRQVPLPETALELCAVANSFAPVKGDVYLGSEATEAKIKSLSDDGRLAQYRVLHFATHGALSGQVHGSIEPGIDPDPAGIRDISRRRLSLVVGNFRSSSSMLIGWCCRPATRQAARRRIPKPSPALRVRSSMRARAPSSSRTGRSAPTPRSRSPPASLKR